MVITRATKGKVSTSTHEHLDIDGDDWKGERHVGVSLFRSSSKFFHPIKLNIWIYA